MKKTYTEKRFFEWHEDEVSVTLRNKSGSYGGGRRCSSSHVHGSCRSVVCNGLQVGTAGTSRPGETDRDGDGMKKVLYTITMNSYQQITEADEPISSILCSDSHRGGV